MRERTVLCTFVSMDKVDMVRLLQQLLADSRERETAAVKRAGQAEAESAELRVQLGELQAQLSHVISLLEKSNGTSEKLADELRLYGPKKCERVRSGENSPEAVVRETSSPGDESAAGTVGETTQKPSRWSGAKSRGNNHARRKEYFCSEVQHHEVWPEPVGETGGKSAKVLRTRTVVRYEYVPGKFIKHVYTLNVCRVDGKAVTPLAPWAPVFNSNFDSSFIAAILQLRYAYFLPVERIARLFNECGFDVGKGTLDSLLAKAYALIESMDGAMRRAILEDTYINMDESFLTVLEQGARSTSGIYSSKAYVWCAQARHLNLVHMFYDKGSRGKEVFTDYLPGSYRGAVQTDGLASYREIQGEGYPDAIHLTCWQHCKREFLDIKESADAGRIVRKINKLYQKDHRIGEGWSPEKTVKYRQEYAPPIFKEIEDAIKEVLAKPTTLPKSALCKACNRVLNQFEPLCAYINGAEYDLDNNAIERTMRTISMSRRSSLFAASHEGAKRSALFYSLACSCKLHNINTFEYFKDILDALAKLPDTKRNQQIIRELLPDKWARKER